MPPLHPFVELVFRNHFQTVDNISSTPNTSSSSHNRPQPPTSSPPQRSLVRPPPGFSTIPQHAHFRPLSPASRPNAINTSPPAPQVRHFAIIELLSGRVHNSWTTAFLLADSQTGHLFHGALPCAPWLRNYTRSGIDVIDFKVGNLPIRPICDTFIYPKFSEGKDSWLRYVPSPFTHPVLARGTYVKRPDILKGREFLWNSDGVAARLRNEIMICERIRLNPPQCPVLAEYKGVEVDEWGRVTGIAYKGYNANLLEFVASRRLEKMHIPLILDAVAKAVRHLGTLGVVYGSVAPENVYVNYMWHDGHVFLGQIVLGDFEGAVVGEKPIVLKDFENALVEEKPIVKKEEVLVGVERETEWLGRVFKAEEEEVWEVGTEMGLRTEMVSILMMEDWMRRQVGL